MKHVILFGGSFDPIHFGHLEITKQALKQTKADELWFVLAAQSPFKEQQTSFKDRATMINIMINPYNKIKICEIENELPLPSYSYDTLMALKQKYPNYKFNWLIGSDQLESLDKWKNSEALKREADFILYQRPGFDLKHDFKLISGLTYDLSSTEIRQGKSQATSPGVLRYMMYQGLYLNEMTENRMSSYRYQHTLNVTELALELAEHWNVDLKVMRLAAMTHDWCKEMDSLALKRIMKASYPELLYLNPHFYHAFAGTYILSRQYYIRDSQLLSAIRGHVNGQSTSKVGMILFIADKCEKGRKYDTTPFIDLAKKNLIVGFQAVKLSSEQYVKEQL